MLLFVGRRTLASLLLVVWIVLAVFTILRLTSGDPARIRAPVFARADVLQKYREEFGTDKPFQEQLWRFVSGIPRGDLGVSFRYQEPVVGLMVDRLPLTLTLGFLSWLLTLLLALGLGIAAAHNRGGLIDRLALMLAVFGQSAPMFWVGLMLVLIFSVRLGWVPPVGYQGLKSLALPVITISLSVLPGQVRVVRSAMIDVLVQDFIRSARAFGLPRWRVNYVYALRNAAVPLVTVMGIDLGYLLGGAIVAEVVFNLPGIGKLAIEGLNARDYPVVQGITVVTASLLVFVNLIVDLLYMIIDPRIRVEG